MDLGVAVEQHVVTAEAAGVELHLEDLVGGGLVGEVVEALRVVGDPQESTVGGRVGHHAVEAGELGEDLLREVVGRQVEEAADPGPGSVGGHGVSFRLVWRWRAGR